MTDVEPAAPAPGASTRIASLDILRSVALGGMVIYHVLWDVHASGLSTTDPRSVAAVRWLGDGVAAGFLLISGVSLALAERAGHSWPRKLRRLALLALAAGLVTLVTWSIWPDLAVRFGILHCLVAANAITLAARRAPKAALVVAGAACLALPVVWPWPLGAPWAWIGLSRDVPATLDIRPLLPWLAFVLFGFAAGRTAPLTRMMAVNVSGAAARCAAFAGRHSLAVYLLHQPAFLAILATVAIALGVDRPSQPAVAASEAKAFLDACTQACSVSGDASVCRATCHCVLTAAARPDVGFRGVLGRVQDPQAKLRRAAQACSPASPATHQDDSPRQ